MSNTSSKKNNLPLKIGVTGGIGSGKSLVCQIFKTLKVPVFEADREAKEIIDSDSHTRQALEKLLGNGILGPDGKINRHAMAGIIFNDQELLKEVNAIIHPAVRHRFNSWHAEQKSRYIIQEAAILFESGVFRMMDMNIVVTAPEEMRIRRVMQRDGVTNEKVYERMKNQWPEEEKVAMADYIIRNDESQSLIQQVLEIHQKILNYGKIR
ncbi:dephospho-CoA kinase [Bacteroidales bacterium 6E]|nr:dephospho-CoA kinase [Bacteroidales bacterium 6E]